MKAAAQQRMVLQEVPAANAAKSDAAQVVMSSRAQAVKSDSEKVDLHAVQASVESHERCYERYVSYKNRILILGFGSIGQGVLPLILRHIDLKKNQITVLTADERGHEVATACGVTFVNQPVTKENYKELLGQYLAKGDFLLNLSIDVGSSWLVSWCLEQGVMYLDTCISSWLGSCADTTKSAVERSLYFLREEALALDSQEAGRGATSILTHGANPGLVNHFVKKALLNMAADTGVSVDHPKTDADWAKLAHILDVKAIHIAERDTQRAENRKKPGEFVNTWSIDGLYDEGLQPAELGWGSHEKALPHDGVSHDFGSGAAIYLQRPGYRTQVRSWTPLAGPYQGFLITHNEAISLSDYLTLKDAEGKVVYRPTCHYAYHPCDDAVVSLHELAGRQGKLQDKKRLITDEIVDGTDELGVLLMGNPKGVYWYGSRLSIHEARRLAPYNNATSLQVTAPVMAGLVWAIENPSAGVVEPEQMDYQRILEICTPYLGDVVGVWGDWNPLQGRLPLLFPEDVDVDDPWQFKNIRVV